MWSYTIGGYQVIKKWLSYRERPLLGRDLTPDEARYVTEMARRIAAILLLEPALDANYDRGQGRHLRLAAEAASIRGRPPIEPSLDQPLIGPRGN